MVATLRNLLLAALLAARPGAALAAPAACGPADWCASVPRDASGKPAYNTIDPSRPFVVGGTDVVSLSGKAWQPGPLAGTPTVLVVEDATVAVEGSAGGEGTVAGQLVLCDRARLRVSRGALRLRRAPDAAALPVRALAHSSVVVEASSTLEAALHPGAGSQVTVKDSRLEAVVFESCPGVALALDGLPDVVGADGQPAPVATRLAPPQVPFTLDLQATTLAAWRVRARDGASVAIRNAGERARLEVALDLGGDGRAVELLARQGGDPLVSGLPSGKVTFEGAAVRRLDLEAAPGAQVRLLAGSHVADCLLAAGATVTAVGSTLSGGAARVAAGARLHLVESALLEPLENLGPFLCQRCDLRSSLTTRSTVWLADTRLGKITKDARWPGSQFYEVALMSPESGARVSGEVVVKGSLTANGVMTEKLLPFPPARLDLVRLDTGEQRRLASFDNAMHFEELGRFDADALPPGEYELRLAFDSELGALAPSTRRVTVEPRRAKGCGCGSSGPGAGPLAVACAALALVPRRRPSPRPPG